MEDMACITRGRLGSDLNHHDQDEKQRKDPCQLCTEADRHVVFSGSCNVRKQETNDLCSYIAREIQLLRLGLGILLAFWLTQARCWINKCIENKTVFIIR
jgi:hypothetical protein